MTDEVASLVLEHLRSMRGDTTSIKDELKGTRSEITAMRHQMHGMNTLIEQCLEDVGTIKVRLDRIEGRLDIVEPAK